MSDAKTISLVTPCYNEEYYIFDVYAEVKKVFKKKLPNYNWELIYVENGSSDNSFANITELAATDSRVKSVKLSRNFKYQGGIIAGLNHAQGDAVVIFDCDLQDPVNIIPEFVAEWEAGNQVVYGVKASRKEGIVKRTAYHSFYYLMQKLSEYKFPMEAGEFSLMDRKVYTILTCMREKNKFIRALRFWTGFNQSSISYDRHGRDKGETKHPIRAMFSLAIDGLLSFSGFPLRLILLLGSVVTLGSIIGIAYILYWKMMNPSTIPGYAATMVTIFFMGGVQMLSLGVIGEFVYRMYNELRDRPEYIVDEVVNIQKKPCHSNSAHPLNLQSPPLRNKSQETQSKIDQTIEN